MARRASVLAAISIAVSPATAVAQWREATTFDRARIAAAGWSRVTELLEAATGWSRASLDGFTFAASADRLPASGASAAGMPEWTLFVNGRETATSVLGAHFLELLPITVSEIDSVVVTRGPTLVRGTLAPRGAIEVFTERRKPSGAYADASYQHGDETGDPGPYRYTTLSSPNVEKIGPFAQARAGFTSSRWSMDAASHFASMNVTDTLITSRFLSGGFGALPPQVSAAGASARLAAEAFGGHHELTGWYAQQRGLFFVPALQQAQAATIDAPGLNLNGIARVQRFVVDYDASATEIKVDSIGGPLPLTLAHTRRRLSARATAQRKVGDAALNFGGGVVDWSFERASVRTARAAAFLDASLASNLGSRARAALEVNASRSASSTGGGATVNAVAELDSSRALGVTVSAMRLLPELDGSWIDRALASSTEPVRIPAFFNGEATVALRKASVGRVVGAAFVERVVDWTLATDTARAVTLAGARVRVETAPARLRAQLAYSITAPVTADDAMRRVIESTVRNELRVDLIGNVGDDLTGGLTIGLADGTTWLSVAPGETSTPPLRRVDLSLEKWGWHRRLHVQLVVRNALDAPERYHPFGAQWNLRAHVSAGITLP